MKRNTAPIGGILASFFMELVIYPAIFAIWKWNFEVKPTIKRTKPPQPHSQPEQEVLHAESLL